MTQKTYQWKPWIVMNEINIKIGAVGKIIEGRHKDWYIYVEDDFENTGGYLIFTFKDINRLNGSQVYDRWAENKTDLLEMFKSAEYRVDWLDEKIT